MWAAYTIPSDWWPSISSQGEVPIVSVISQGRGCCLFVVDLEKTPMAACFRRNEVTLLIWGGIFFSYFSDLFFSRLLAPVSVVFPLESSFVAILFKVLFSGLWRTRIKEEKNSWIVVHLENSL